LDSLKHVVDSLDLHGDMAVASRNTAFDAPLLARYDSANTGRSFYSYLALRGFNIPAGTRVDTCMPDTSGSGIDSMGIKFIVCFVKIGLTAPSALGTCPLGYFVGFAPTDLAPPSQMSQRQVNAFQDSNLIIVTNTPAIERLALAGTPEKLSIKVSPNPARGAVSLAYYLPKEMAGQPVEVAVYNIKGARVYVNNGVGIAGWNRSTCLKAGTLPSGTYVAKIRAGNQSVSRTLVIMK